MALRIPPAVLVYLKSDKPQFCELDVQPWLCEFWPSAELETFNEEYEVQRNAPGYCGFATSGGGEMFAISPSGAVVCLPFIGMSPDAELLIAEGWAAFEKLLQPLK